MSNNLCSYKSDKTSTNNTLPDTNHKNISSRHTARDSDSSNAVANCIRGLNHTIESLTKENLLLRKNLEEFSSKIQEHEKKNKKLKLVHSLKENNEKLEKEIIRLKASNSELHERYNRVKEMYDLIVEKQNPVGDFDKLRIKAVESEDLRKANKKLKELNSEYLLEIENLNGQVEGLKMKIRELQDSRKFVLEEHKKSGEFVNEIAKINEELLRFIKVGNKSCKKAGIAKGHKGIRKVVSERGSFGKVSMDKHTKY